jgi:hypothetical protein
MGVAALTRPAFVLSDGRSPTAAARLAATLSDQASARRLGAVYLRITPREANLRTLVSKVGGHLPVRAVHKASRDELRRHISQAIYSDFTVGRTVKLDGWVMSRTEARVCAIAALAAKR